MTRPPLSLVDQQLVRDVAAARKRLGPGPHMPRLPEGAENPDHVVTVRRSDVLPRGWSEAWVWTCSCFARSDSIMRTVNDAETDHRTEHLATIRQET